MKKRSVIVLLAAALTIGNAVPAAAAPYCGGGNGRCGQNYVDADGDGVCDNFVDEDGDGINDNCPGYGNGRGQGRGQGQGRGNGHCGQNYVDADGDGVCDNFVDEDGDGINDNCPAFGNGQGLQNNQAQEQSKAVTAVSAKKNNVKKAGVTKNMIKKVQKRLNKIGYNCGKVSGTMNAKTKKALKKFKKENGLKANSSITARTLKALKISK